MTEVDLFNYGAIGPRSRRQDPTTSHEAGDAAEKFLNAHHEVILKALRESGGQPLAAEQIADRGDLKSHVAVNRRLSECVDRGLIVRTEERHINRSGRGAFKYALIKESRGG